MLNSYVEYIVESIVSDMSQGSLAKLDVAVKNVIPEFQKNDLKIIMSNSPPNVLDMHFLTPGTLQVSQQH